MSEIKLGMFDLFQVIKLEKDGYIIKNNHATVMLLKSEATKSLSIGDQVDVFLYLDHSKAVSATMKPPKIDLFRADFVNVVEKKDGLGVFVDIGISKDMLLSKDDLPHLKSQWPDVGDTVFCYLKVGKNQMTAKRVSRFRVLDYLKPTTTLAVGDKVNAFVFHLSEEGVVLFTETGHELFVYYKHTRQAYRLGQAAEATITVVKDAMHYNATLIEQKELMLETDAETIYAYLQKNKTMPLTDKSNPEAIFDAFHMSKSAFKRALGQLYKAGMVELETDATTLKE